MPDDGMDTGLIHAVLAQPHIRSMRSKAISISIPILFCAAMLAGGRVLLGRIGFNDRVDRGVSRPYKLS